MAFRLVVFFAILLTGNVWSLPEGAPEEACGDMTPQHGVPPQSTPAPYKVLVNKNEIHGREPVEITLRGDTSANTIKGFLVQARVGDVPLGTFDVTDIPEMAHTLNCGHGFGNAVTHKKHEGLEDPQSIVLKWRPTPGFQGTIKFRATILYKGEEFWVGLQSEDVEVKL